MIEAIEPIVLKRPAGGCVKFSVSALRQICLFRQGSPDDLEAGGVLLGRYIKGSNDIVVDLVTTPLERDVRSRYRFTRCDPGHQSTVEQLWKESSGTTNYLGEWHTHPEEYPTPSSEDSKNTRRILTLAEYDSESLFFAILGTRCFRVWEAFRATAGSAVMEQR